MRLSCFVSAPITPVFVGKNAYRTFALYVPGLVVKFNTKVCQSNVFDTVLDITHHSLPIISEHSLPAFQCIVYQLEAALKRIFQSKVYHSLVCYS